MILLGEKTLIDEPHMRIQNIGNNIGKVFTCINFSKEEVDREQQLLNHYTNKSGIDRDDGTLLCVKNIKNILISGESDPFDHQKDIIDLLGRLKNVPFEIETSLQCKDLLYDFIKWCKGVDVQINIVVDKYASYYRERVEKMISIFDKEDIKYIIIFSDDGTEQKRESIQQFISNIHFGTPYNLLKPKLPIYVRSAEELAGDISSTFWFCEKNHFFYSPKIDAVKYKKKPE